MLPVDSSAIFNQEQYKIEEVLKSIRNDNVFEKLVKMQQSDMSQSANKAANYDGNYININSKTIFAMAGPTNDAQLNTLLHEFTGKERQIKTAISLLKNEDGTDKYCANYFHKEFKVNCSDFDLSVETVQIHAGVISGNLPDYDTHCVYTRFNVNSKLAVKQTKLEVYSLPIASGGTIIKKRVLDDGVRMRNTQYINFLLECFDAWFNNGIVAIHCEFGSKRTALLVIAFFLLAEFERIFIANNPQQTAQNIFQICQQIMQQRKVFNPDVIQFYSAIELAFQLKVAKEYQLTCNKSMGDTSLPSSPYNTDNLISLLSLKSSEETLSQKPEVPVENKVVDKDLVSSRNSVNKQTADTLFWKNTNIQLPAPASGEKDKPQSHQNDFQRTITLA